MFLLGLITAFRVIDSHYSLFYYLGAGWCLDWFKTACAQIVQPIAQFLAAFPANLLYPFIVIFIVTLSFESEYLGDTAHDFGVAMVYLI